MNEIKTINYKKLAENMFLFLMAILAWTWFIVLMAFFMNPWKHNVQSVPSTWAVNTGVSTDPNLINFKPTPRRRLNENGLSQRYIPLESEWREDRMKELLSHYDNAPDYTTRQVVARIYRVYPEALICIAYADSSLGNFLKTKNNFGNVGNNDRWDSVSHSTPETWNKAIGKVLNKQYPWGHKNKKKISK